MLRLVDDSGPGTPARLTPYNELSASSSDAREPYVALRTEKTRRKMRSMGRVIAAASTSKIRAILTKAPMVFRWFVRFGRKVFHLGAKVSLYDLAGSTLVEAGY